MTGRAGVDEPAAMFGRKRKADPLQREAAERRRHEDEQPWFLVPDDAPELEVEAGRSARMDDEDEAGTGP